MRDYTKRPAANGRWQLWLDGDTWYAIDPQGSIDDAMRQGATPEESRRIAHDGIRYLNDHDFPDPEITAFLARGYTVFSADSPA